MKIIFNILFTLFFLDSFCQTDSLLVSIGSVKNVTGISLQYSKDNVNWVTKQSVAFSRTGDFAYASAVPDGYYRMFALGRNEYSNIVNIYSVLPVTLSNWQVQTNRNNDILFWTSANESNIKKYLISRSVDGIHFSQVLEVAAKGNSDYRITIAK